MREIAQVCGVSHNTVVRICKKIVNEGIVASGRIAKCGKKLTTTARERRMVLSVSKKNPKALTNEIKQKLSIDVSFRTFRHILFNGGRKVSENEKTTHQSHA